MGSSWGHFVPGNMASGLALCSGQVPRRKIYQWARRLLSWDVISRASGVAASSLMKIQASRDGHGRTE